VGTDAGLKVIMLDGSWETYTYENSDLIQRTIRSLSMGSQSRLWIGTDASLGVFVPEAP
jgi:ligand-binding sensor domain-containing protein